MSTSASSSDAINQDANTRISKRKAEDIIADGIADVMCPGRVAMTAAIAKHTASERRAIAEKLAMRKSPKYLAYDLAYRTSQCVVLNDGWRCDGDTTLGTEALDDCSCGKRPAYGVNYQPTLCVKHYDNGCIGGLHGKITARLDTFIKEAKEEVQLLTEQEMETLCQEEAATKATKIRKLLADLDACSAV